MHINLILIPFVIILGLICSQNNTKRERLNYILICSGVLLIVAALRSPDWLNSRYGIDTLIYKQYFEQTLDMNWDEVKIAIYLRYFQNNGDYDVGFVALSRLIGVFTNDFFVFSLIADLLFFVPFGIILYRYSTNAKQIMFAYVFYISLVQTYLLGGARQMFSIGFDMMALLAMMNKKRLRSILWFLLGVTVHMSSFIFLVPLLMIWIETKPRALKALHFICFLAFPIVLAFPNELISFMGDTIGMEKYSNYGESPVQGGATTFIILIEMLSLFIWIAIKRKDLELDSAKNKLYVMAPLFTLFAPLIHSNGSMDRITLYFYLYIVLLVPYGIECMFMKKERNVAYIMMIGALAILSMFKGGLEYYFFWQR